MRDLFPHECFKNQPYGNIDIHQLRAAEKNEQGEVSVSNKEAFLLTQWVEKGVFAALEAEYLSSLIFAIYSNHPITGESILLETYEFRLSYQSDSPATINNTPIISKEGLKQQAGKFIRSLTEFTGTLDDIPNERWVTMQLKYVDRAPIDYEPEFFKASEDSLLSHQSLPLKIKLGFIKTSHMEMHAKFAGLESLLFEDLCKIIPYDANIIPEIKPKSIPQSTFRGKSYSSENSKHQTQFADDVNANDNVGNRLKKCSINDEFSDEKISQRDNTNDNPTISYPVIEKKKGQSDDHKKYDEVKSYILQEGKAIQKQLMSKFSMDITTIKSIFNKLTNDGTIQQKGRGYIVIGNDKLSQESNQEKIDFPSTQPQLSPDQVIQSKGFKSIPAAPKKSIQPVKNTQLFGSDDIEETNIEDSKQFDNPSYSKNFHPTKPPQLLLRPETHTITNQKVNKSNDDNENALPETIGIKREISYTEKTISLSQTSENSDGFCKKSKYSVIADPIHLKKYKIGLSTDYSN
jgi:hypothetical protein